MPTIPYLHFQNGQCTEAMAFYADILGGTDLEIMRYADGPGAPAEWQGQPHIMHSQMRIADGTLMGSDFPPGTTGDPQKACSVMQSLPTVAEARTVYERLLDGGDVIQEFRPSFFAPGFGMVRDRFGTHWIITADAE